MQKKEQKLIWPAFGQSSSSWQLSAVTPSRASEQHRDA